MGHLRPEKRSRITPPPAAATRSPTIPDELLIWEILVRLPVKSLMRFKCVCRSWRGAIADDPAFVRRHLELSRARPPSMLVVPRRDEIYNDDLSEEISFHRLRLGETPGTVAAEADLMFEKVPPEGIACDIIPTHCDGLVAVATSSGQVFVCNPATQEFVPLPLGSRDVQDYPSPAAALGFDPWRNRYVVARYFYRKYDELFDEVTGEDSLDYDIGHEVFTLGGDSWQLTENPPRPIAPDKSPICIRGAFYWPIYEDEPKALLRFSLRDEAFDSAPCPPGCTGCIRDLDSLTDLAGKLCFVHRADNMETTFDVWLADGGPRSEWSLLYRVDMVKLDRCVYNLDMVELDRCVYNFVPVAAGGDETLLAVHYRKLYRYDVQSKALEELVDMQRELQYERQDGSRYTYDPSPTMHHVLPYVESLLSISACKD